MNLEHGKVPTILLLLQSPLPKFKVTEANYPFYMSSVCFSELSLMIINKKDFFELLNLIHFLSISGSLSTFQGLAISSL